MTMLWAKMILVTMGLAVAGLAIVLAVNLATRAPDQSDKPQIGKGDLFHPVMPPEFWATVEGLLLTAAGAALLCGRGLPLRVAGACLAGAGLIWLVLVSLLWAAVGAVVVAAALVAVLLTRLTLRRAQQAMPDLAWALRQGQAPSQSEVQRFGSSHPSEERPRDEETSEDVSG
jgi:hypothetical protein